MKEFYHFFEKIGVDFALMLAGLFGGIAFVSKPNEMNNAQKFLTVITGVSTANYLTPVVMWLFNIPAKLGFGLAFLLGFTGLKAIELIIRKWEQFKTKAK